MMKLAKRFRNQRGFIELEYLVAAGIGLVVIAGFATGIQQMSTMQRRNDVAQDSNFLVEDLVNAVKTGDFCTDKLQGINVPPAGTAMAIQFPYPMMDTGTEVLLKEGAEPIEGVSIKTLRLLRVPYSGTAVKITTKQGVYQQVPTVLRIQTEKLVNGQNIAMKTRDIPLTLSVEDATGNIKYCNKDSMAAQACFESGGTYDELANWQLGETKCMPANHCDYGGTFSDDPAAGFPNPLMNPPSAQCPRGYKPERSGTVSAVSAAPKYNGSISNHYYGITTCIRCGPTLVAQGAATGGSFDINSLGPIESSIAGMPGYRSQMGGHITSTGQQVGAYAAPAPIATPNPPPTPTPVPTPDPNATPPPGCNGSAYAVSSISGNDPYQQSDCPGGTSVVAGQYYGDPWSGYGGYFPGYCACNNYQPPTPTPTPTPVSCAPLVTAYTDQYGADGQCPDIQETSATPIYCSIYAGHATVYDVCTYNDYFYATDGAAASYIPPYYGYP